jgi:hypothetical protein
MQGASWWPTKKWWTALIAGVFTIGAHALGSGGWDHTEWAELLGMGASLATAYGTSNDSTPGGVPLTKTATTLDMPAKTVEKPA